MLQMLVRILNHHHGGIDHGTNGDGNSSQRHDVGIHALVMHDDKCGQDAQRQ